MEPGIGSNVSLTKQRVALNEMIRQLTHDQQTTLVEVEMGLILLNEVETEVKMAYDLWSSLSFDSPNYVPSTIKDIYKAYHRRKKAS